MRGLSSAGPHGLADDGRVRAKAGPPQSSGNQPWKGEVEGSGRQKSLEAWNAQSRHSLLARVLCRNRHSTLPSGSPRGPLDEAPRAIVIRARAGKIFARRSNASDGEER